MCNKVENKNHSSLGYGINNREALVCRCSNLLGTNFKFCMQHSKNTASLRIGIHLAKAVFYQRYWCFQVKEPELPAIFFSMLCFDHFLLGFLVCFFLHTKFHLELMLGIYLKVHMMKRTKNCSFHHMNF